MTVLENTYLDDLDFTIDEGLYPDVVGSLSSDQEFVDAMSWVEVNSPPATVAVKVLGQRIDCSWNYAFDDYELQAEEDEAGCAEVQVYIPVQEILMASAVKLGRKGGRRKSRTLGHWGEFVDELQAWKQTTRRNRETGFLFQMWLDFYLERFELDRLVPKVEAVEAKEVDTPMSDICFGMRYGLAFPSRY